MKDNPNDQFPLVGFNGSGSKHQETKSETTNNRPSNKASQQSGRAKLSTKAEQPQRSTTDQTKRNSLTTQNDVPKPTELIKAKLSAYISNYPLQTIAGLLAILAVIVLFKTFYQGKNWKAKRMAEEAYYVANQYAKNNSTNLYPYLSQAFRREVHQLPGLLPLSMQTATRGGTVTGAESVGLREITPDSVVVEVALRYDNGSGAPVREEKRFQPLVYEKDQWRLGLTYSR